jgi:hypothetical protein
MKKIMIVISIMMAMFAQVANADRVAYKITSSKNFAYIVELSDTTNATCGKMKNRAFLSVSDDGSIYARPFAEGCWQHIPQTDEITAEFTFPASKKRIYMRDLATDYTFEPGKTYNPKKE